MIQQIQKDPVEMVKLIIQKIKKNFLYILFAVVCTAAFFVHMQLPSLSAEVSQSKENFLKLKNENTTALNKLKSLNFDLAKDKITIEEFQSQQKTLVNSYLLINSSKNVKYKEHQKLLKSERFLGFDNFQKFLGEFGWAFGLLMYALFNLLITFYEKAKQNIGKVIVHSTLVYIGLFYSYYPFKFPFTPDSDYSRSTYFWTMLLTTLAVVIGSYLIADYFRKHIQSLLLNIKDLIGFMFNNTKEDKEDEMWNVLKDVKHDR